MRIHDYETWGHLDFSQERLCEAYSGSDIVQWYGRIERQLRRMLDEAEQGRNYPAEAKLRGFLKIWRDNQITGSINIENITPLEAASDILSLDNNTSLSSYFGSLRDSLRKLIASEEELPRDADMGNEPLAGGGGGGPPMAPDFGPEGEIPPGEEGDGQPPPDMPPPGAEGAGGPEAPGDTEGEAEPEPEELRL